MQTLSRLSIEDNTDLSDVCETDSFHIYYLEKNLIAFNSKTLKTESRKDKTISNVIRYISNDWPNYDELSSEKENLFQKTI